MAKIALDAMGGDHMPDAAVEGAVRAAADGVDVVLVGDEDRLRAALAGRDARIAIRHAADVISMDDAASEVRRRKESSVMVAAAMVRDGEADAFVSMGHSGATMAAGLFGVGRLPGVERPAILATFPVGDDFVAVLDVGANAEARPAHLQQFAVMGSVYAERVFGRANPSVGLMSIGEEPNKGNDLVLAAHPLLRDTPGLHFHGNVEGRDVFRRTVDVVVTDGFTGNVMLKLAEGEARALFGWVRDALASTLRSRLGGLLVRPALRRLATRLDPDSYGAQPLLGVKAPVFIGHGSSDARAVASALRFAATAVRADLVPSLAEATSRLTAPASRSPESS